MERAAHKARITVGDATLTVHRSKNGRRYRAEVTGRRHAFLDIRDGGEDRNRLKRIINGDEIEAKRLLEEMTR